MAIINLKAVGNKARVKIFSNPVELTLQSDFNKWSEENPAAYIVKISVVDNGHTTRIVIFYFL